MTKNEIQEVLPADRSVDGIVWEILGQTYRPKQVTDASFAWHATLPPGTLSRRTSTRPSTSTSTC